MNAGRVSGVAGELEKIAQEEIELTNQPHVISGDPLHNQGVIDRCIVTAQGLMHEIRKRLTEDFTAL